MKRFTSPAALLLAFLLSSGAVQAQRFASKIDVKRAAGSTVHVDCLAGSQRDAAVKAPMRIVLPSNQKILGAYDTDDVATQGLGLRNNPGTVSVASLLDINDVLRFDGGDVVSVRYGLANAATVSSVFMYGIDSDGNFSVIFDKAVTGASVAGWNTVTFAEPYRLALSGYESLLLGFEYLQTADAYDYGSYPLSFTGDGSTTLCYLDLEQGAGWYDFGLESYGSLSIQAIVEKDYPEKDMALSGLSVGDFFRKAGEKQTYSFKIKNYGAALSSYTVNVAVDDNVVSVLETPVAMPEGASEQYTGELTLAPDLLNGRHTLTVSLAKIEGDTPSVNTSDDVSTAMFSCYDESFPHQKTLVEHMTSTSCTYCPYGDEILKTLASKRDDIARVSLHGTQNVSYPDPFLIDDNYTIFAYEDMYGYPSASFNRVCFDLGVGDGKVVVQTIGYPSTYKEQVASMLSDAIDANNKSYPAFATIGIDASHNAEEGNIIIKVTGTGVKDFSTFMGEDAVLNVFLVEDGLVEKQLNNGRWVSN